jgi:hypothetical protein
MLTLGLIEGVSSVVWGSCYPIGEWVITNGNTNYGGDGMKYGSSWYERYFYKEWENYMDLSFSGVGPTEPASDTSTADGNNKS